MNSLKRKKSTTASVITNKKGKTAGVNESRNSSRSSPNANVSFPALESLDHLIDRPYAEYDPQTDDIGNNSCLA